MSEESNVFSQAASALSKVEQLVISGRQSVDTIEESRSSTEEATREIQSIRSEVLSARNDLSAAVQQVRELNTELGATIDKHAQELSLQTQRGFKRVIIMMTILMLITLALGAAASYPLMLEYGFIGKP